MIFFSPHTATKLLTLTINHQHFNEKQKTKPKNQKQPRADLENANSKEYLENLKTSLLKLVAAMPAAPNSGQTLGGERPADAPVAADAMEMETGGEGDEREEERGGDRPPSSSRKQPLWDGTRDEAEDAADGK